MRRLFKRVAILVGWSLLMCAPVLASRGLKDELGRRVTLPDNPQRVICLAPSLTETVYALGLGKLVVGITDYTDYPPEAKAKPSVGGLTDPSLEKIVSLHPDLVLAMAEVNREETVDELEHAGIPVFVADPEGLEGILASVQDVGDALNEGSKARALVKRLEVQRAAVVARVKGLPRPKVLVVIWYDPLITAGSKSFVTDVISDAGAQSVTANIHQAWPQISLEEMLHLSPDFILLVRGAHEGITLGELKVHAGWDQLEAVRRNRVIYMDERLFHPSPVLFDAMEQLAKELHPGAF